MKLEHTYAETFPGLAKPATPFIPLESKVSWVNEPLAQELGLDATWLATSAGLNWLTGTAGDSVPTFALAYSGFQFGNLSPLLGDGRAHLVGELAKADDENKRVDLHLKGSGLTPFSRTGADGKAPLSAVWREAVMGEFFAALDVPTSRALVIIETGEKVQRRGSVPEPAGILVRVAASHLRVGTFQFAQMNLGEDERDKLVNYALERHYPQVYSNLHQTEKSAALELFRAVADQQADLLAQWMGLGFVHGVLNTDNVTISGESIDFGPCAFIDEFRFEAVFSSIDRQGRYSFRNQPSITQWNLARFAESLIDLMGKAPNLAVEQAGEILTDFEERFQRRWVEVFAAKLGVGIEGVEDPVVETLRAFIGRTLNMLERESLDFTGFFRALTDARRDEIDAEWLRDLEELRLRAGTEADVSQRLMEVTNPVYIPRDFRVDNALGEMTRGNEEPLRRLLRAIRNPLQRQDGLEELEEVPASSRPFVSYCGT